MEFRIEFEVKLEVKFEFKIEFGTEFDNPCIESIISFSNSIEIENCQFVVFLFSSLN